MIQFLHEPSMVKVEYLLGAAFFCFVSLWVLVVMIYYETRPDIYRPAYFLLDLQKEPEKAEKSGVFPPFAASETAEDEDETEDLEPALGEDIELAPVRLKHKSSGNSAYKPPLRQSITQNRIVFTIICITIVTSGSLLGGRMLRVVRLLDKAENSYAAKEFKDAEQYCRNAVKIDPRAHKSHLMLGEILVSERKLEPAIPEMRLGLEGDRFNASAHVLLGDALQTLQRPEQAEPEYRKAIAIAPRRASCYVRLGSCLSAMDRSDDAITELKYAVNLDPDDVKAQANLGSVLMQVGKIMEGIDHLKRAVQLNPRDVGARNTLAIGYAQEQMYADAVREFRGELAQDPEFAVGYFNLGATLKQAGDIPGAIDAYESYIRKCANNPEARLGIPSVMQQLKALKAQLIARQHRE